MSDTPRRRRRKSTGKEQATSAPEQIPVQDETPPQPHTKPDSEERNREMETINTYKERIKNPISAIRSHCVECMGGAVQSVKDCPSVNCSLHPFRMGVNVMHAAAGKARPGQKAPPKGKKK